MKKIFFFLLLYQGCFIANAEIFKWVDDTGQTHYGDKPVKSAEKLNISIKKNGNLSVGSRRLQKQQQLMESFKDDRQRSNKEKAKVKKHKLKRKRACIETKDRLRQFERARSLYNLDKDGNRVSVSNDIRQKNTEALRQRIKSLCN